MLASISDSPQLCECGCGEPAPIAPRTYSRSGWVKGQPIRFIHGHWSRAQRGPDVYRVEDRGHSTPCWVWQLSTNRDGYGRARMPGERAGALAHRVYYQEMVGPIPEGLTLDHLCRVRACVNPTHLEPVPNAENVRRGRAAKLTLTDIAEIRRLLGDGLTNITIAQRFGIAPKTVSRIKTGKRWAV